MKELKTSNGVPPLRLRFTTVCELLDVSSEGLRYIIKTDPSFPQPLKCGSSKQSPVYFDYQELVEWHQSKLNERAESNE